MLPPARTHHQWQANSTSKTWSVLEHETNFVRQIRSQIIIRIWNWKPRHVRFVPRRLGGRNSPRVYETGSIGRWVFGTGDRVVCTFSTLRFCKRGQPGMTSASEVLRACSELRRCFCCISSSSMSTLLSKGSSPSSSEPRRSIELRLPRPLSCQNETMQDQSRCLENRNWKRNWKCAPPDEASPSGR